jgi:FkbM family methyltransferase
MLKTIWREIIAPRVANRVAPRVADILRPDLQQLVHSVTSEYAAHLPEPAIPEPKLPGILQVFKGYEEQDLRLFDEFLIPERQPREGFIVDFLGARTRVSSLFDAVAQFNGHVHGLPIPGDWHAEAVEWLGLLKTAKTARDRYVAMEWGAGWAPWLVAGATAAGHLGVTDSRLYGIEADPVHFSAMHQHFVDNDLPPERHVLLQAAVGAVDGKARWPRHSNAQNRWGDRPVREGYSEDDDYLDGLAVGFMDVNIIAASDLLHREPLWDMIHIDIQGWEGEVCRSCIKLLNERAKWVIVGVHSRLLDAELLKLFHGAGWLLEHEKPTRFRYAPRKSTFESMVIADGTQVWRNPRLAPTP